MLMTCLFFSLSGKFESYNLKRSFPRHYKMFCRLPPSPCGICLVLLVLHLSLRCLIRTDKTCYSLLLIYGSEGSCVQSFNPTTRFSPMLPRKTLSGPGHQSNQGFPVCNNIGTTTKCQSYTNRQALEGRNSNLFTSRAAVGGHLWGVLNSF